MRSAIIALPFIAALAAACAPVPQTAVDTTQVNVTATFRERLMLSPEHVLTVRIEDVSRADAPAVVIAETSRRVEDRGPPYEVKLDVRNDRIDPRATYAVRAEIREPGGILTFTTDTRHAVLTNGAPNRVEITMVRAQ